MQQNRLAKNVPVRTEFKSKSKSRDSKSESKSKSFHIKSKSKSSKNGLESGLESKSGLEYYKSGLSR